MISSCIYLGLLSIMKDLKNLLMDSRAKTDQPIVSFEVDFNFDI